MNIVFNTNLGRHEQNIDFGPCLSDIYQSLWCSTSTDQVLNKIKLCENSLGLTWFELTHENYEPWLHTNILITWLLITW